MARKRILIIAVIFLSFTLETVNTTAYKFPQLRYFPEMPVNTGNPVTVEGADLGRHLFYDPILSADSSISCASCHKQEFAFSDSPNQFSKGITKTSLARNTLPLFNLAWYPSYFWDGKAASIEAQILQPVRSHDEMDLDWKEVEKRLSRSKYYSARFRDVFGISQIDSTSICKAIGQFERTLLSYRSKYDRCVNGIDHFTQDEAEGFVLVNDMTKGDCLHCHTTDGDALGVVPGFSNNGLDMVMNRSGYSDAGRGSITGDANDNGKFKIPSLRNLGFTAPYMHDGRFRTLQEVLDFYSDNVQQCANLDSRMSGAHRGGVHLTKEERRKVIAFLNTLNDSAFVTDPRFARPAVR
jgi:cytochrome c peroxidase